MWSDLSLYLLGSTILNLMTEIGEVVDSNHVYKAANVTPQGFRGGILKNDLENTLILIQNTEDTETSKYPNYWDESCIGLLHYCGTNKHQSNSVPVQNLNVIENQILNDGSRPIIVYLRCKRGKYVYLGEFTRLPRYDDMVEFNGKEMFRFGLISNNIDAIRPLVTKIIKKGQKYSKNKILDSVL